MSFKSFRNAKNVFYLNRRLLYGKAYIPLELEPGQYPYLRRQIPLDGLKSFDERMKEIERAKAGVIFDPINIGYAIPPQSTTKKDKRPDLEILARKRNLHIDVNKLDMETSGSPVGIKQSVTIAQFFNIYNDLFTKPHFFYPIIPLNIHFAADDDEFIPVYNGNLISPTTASNEPIVRFVSDADSLWTLVLTSPDEYSGHQPGEYVHWMISNIVIKDTEISSRDVIVPYLQPVPYFGTGFHRYVFVLYKQDCGKIDLSSLSLSDNCHLEDRSFRSYNFLKEHQAGLTPTGLSFFQSSWDQSVRQYFRDKLDCLEPLFEYKWPKDKLRPQEKFPEGKEMHTYLDQYRDIKDIQEEVLKERLKTADPFSPIKPLEFPLAVPEDLNEMGFVKEKEKDKVLRRRQWKDMDLSKDI